VQVGGKARSPTERTSLINNPRQILSLPSMNVEYFIAKKVAASGQQSFSRLIIRIAIVAIALSVTVMICANALIAGFKTEISSKIFGFWGHIHITDTDINRSLLEAFPIDKNQAFYPSLEKLGPIEYPVREQWLGGLMEVERRKTTNGGVRQIQVFAIKPGIIEAGERGDNDIEGIILKGVGADFDWAFMQRYIKRGRRLALPDSVMSREILISDQTAKRLRVDTGDTFIIHFVEKGEQLRRRFSISGVYRTGLEEYDQKFALVDIRQIQRLLGWDENQVSGFEVFVDDIDDLVPLAEHIYFEELPTELYAETIRDKLPEIFDWLDLQDINEVVILTLMVIVAIINMVTALMILILERTNMIGVLKSLGATDWSIRKVFLYYAAYIIVLGLLWGNVFGIGLCVLQDQLEFIQLSEENYYLSTAPIELNALSILLLNVGTLLITLVFLIVPSYLVTNISPVKAIRFK
jgi:lipoprotein-releasing system permease protein